ncbi:amino acid ABC transporter permease [Castellaniella sp. S9]|uniref:amino acid ABC transporter permease n=1 Tax=Castellaniella sp. S9 TaxID=2993652 RepID=UPI0022B39423|nr:amino acid ABC transporter permease [Castellaniella sp. S9]
MQFSLTPYAGLQWSDLWFILEGGLSTILLSVVSGAAGTILGCALGWLRERSPVFSWLMAFPVDVIRSVPLIIQFILVNSLFSALGVPLDPLEVGLLTLSLYMGMQTSELVRAGIRAVPVQLQKAGRSLGMTGWQVERCITVPLVLRTMLPAWIGTLIGLTKDTALVSVVGYIELLRAAQIVITRSNEALLILLGVGLFYFVICYPISKYGRWLEQRI